MRVARRRQRWTDAIALVLCVVVAGALLAWRPGPASESVATIALGQKYEVRPGLRLTVTDVALTRQIIRHGDPATTPGAFVVVTVHVSHAVGEDTPNSWSVITREGVEFEDESFGVVPGVGRQCTATVAIEVPSAQLAGARLHARFGGMIRVWDPAIELPLDLDLAVLDAGAAPVTLHACEEEPR